MKKVHNNSIARCKIQMANPRPTQNKFAEIKYAEARD